MRHLSRDFERNLQPSVNYSTVLWVWQYPSSEAVILAIELSIPGQKHFEAAFELATRVFVARRSLKVLQYLTFCWKSRQFSALISIGEIND